MVTARREATSRHAESVTAQSCFGWLTVLVIIQGGLRCRFAGFYLNGPDCGRKCRVATGGAIALHGACTAGETLGVAAMRRL
jgi:hypothetical protein